jgi:hypothetical protein
MLTGPLFKWFGSKWTVSKHYPTPIHDTIVEPFAGSAGYASRYSSKQVLIAEANVYIRSLWLWLIEEATEAKIREIPINIPEGTDIRELGLSHGQALLLKNWQRTNNVGNCWTISPWGNKPGQWTENTRSRVAEEHNQVKHWRVFDDAYALMDSGQEGTWFIDPPYKFNYQYKSEPTDYERLARNVYKLNGQVIVCEAVCQKTGQVPTWLPFVDFQKTVTSRRKQTNNHHSRELIYAR